MNAVDQDGPPLGWPAADFALEGTDSRRYGLADVRGPKGMLVMFICNHCPYVKAVEDRLLRLARELEPRGVQFVAVCSNDSESYPDDAFDKLAARWREKGYGFPYLHDDSQEVARAFGAVCTPDIFVYDQARRLVYRGRIDDSWKDESKVTQRELAAALEAIVEGRPVAKEQRPSMGCSIKWRSSEA
jgi:peroxiredoxin